MQDLKVSIVQTDILWEQKEQNLREYSQKLARLEPGTDLVILPEMFATGFTMNKNCAEAPEGPVLEWMQEIARTRDCVITGSIMVNEGDALFNRLYWVSPDGSYRSYDKRHLFRFGREDEHFRQGNQKLLVTLKGWNISPLICYDLRFPVWARNTYSGGTFEYDLLIYVANWPERRAHHWKSLLIARAIENLSYCIGVNRIGKDAFGLSHSGGSLICDPTGKITGTLEDNVPGIITTTLEAKTLSDWRTRFNVSLDWDRFQLLP